MARMLICSQGHQWEASPIDLALLSGEQIACPLCGGRDVTSAPTVPIGQDTPAPGTTVAQSPTLVGSSPGIVKPTMAQFIIERELGRGGMGVVYQAYDRRRQERVALKTMQRVDPSALYRFKIEFRGMADVAHPNLVTLHELYSDGQQWFFAMELVEGVDFLTYVRAGAAGLEGTGSNSDSGATIAPEFVPGPGVPGPQSPRRPPREDRLRSALRQLVQGISALHDAGKLHRDIKPSNVLVTRGGRVVLTDFGLISELDAEGQHRSTSQQISGTAAYMAPEQAAGQPLSPASDWYCVGVMLFEALTGRLPFESKTLQILLDKQTLDAPVPRTIVASVPDDLNKLCVALLSRSPRARPSGRDLLHRLGSETSAPGEADDFRPVGDQRTTFVGRASHLAALTDAFRDVVKGRTVVAYLQGRSGAGKSALAQRFLDDLLEGEEVVVLVGRCYERESVPYKALDSLVDDLSRYLRRLPTLEVQVLLPREVHLLTRVFPVLGRVEAVMEAPRRAGEIVDPQELRRRAFAALRELLARLGDRRPLVLFIDDLQWGDEDSAAQLTDLVRPPDPPALLLLGCYRSEDEGSSPCLQTLLRPPKPALSALDRRTLAVDALSLSEAGDLTRTLLGRGGLATAVQAEIIARESAGNPYFVHELVQCVTSGTDLTTRTLQAGLITLDGVLWMQVLGLPPGARRLLEIIAVSGRPLEQSVSFQAADLGGDGWAMLAVLRSGRMIRSTGLADHDKVESYHDRIRETVVAHLAADQLQDHHRRLALVLEASGGADPEILAVHWQEARQPERAGDYYGRAAAQAAQALAFDRATRLYRCALKFGPGGGAGHNPLRVQLADALANAGRGGEAAREYLAAASSGPSGAALELRRRAAIQFLISGHVDEGLVVLRAVLNAVGLRLPRSPRLALLSLIWRRAQLRLRGLGFRSRDPDQVAPEDLIRIDICWSGVAGLSIIDPIRGADFQTRSLLLALRAGEPYRIARSLAMEASHVSCGGGRTRGRTARLLHATEGLARQVAHPHALGMAALAKGIAAYLEGLWPQALASCSQAESILRDRCTGVAWELDTAQTFALWSLTYMGEVVELSRRQALLLREAQERGDLFAETNFSTYIMAIVRLGADDPEGADRGLSRVVSQWSRQGFHVQHHNALLARALIDLYTGDGQAAWNHIAEQWRAYTRSLLLRVQQVRINVLELRGTSAVAAAMSAADPGSYLRAAERDAGRLQRERMPWSDALACLIRAGAATVRADRSRATALLAEAATRLDAVAMRIYAEAARRRLGELLGGEDGHALIAQANSWMAGQKIQDPARMAAMLAPGLPR
jgi:serine/threonine protein kinase